MDPHAAPDRVSHQSDSTQSTPPSALRERGSDAKAPTSADPQYGLSQLRRAHTVAKGKNMAEKSSVGEKTARERMVTSLLRVKSSHEALRKRSFKRLDALAASRDGPAATREPNHFTVGNVGQNGKIFLRYDPPPNCLERVKTWGSQRRGLPS